MPGGVGLITGNNLVRRSISFSPLNTSKIRVKVNATVDSVVRIAEVEAWSEAAPPPIDVALASNGATATAQNSTADYSGYTFQPWWAIDGAHHIYPPGGDRYWRDEHGMPTSLEIDFSGTKTISEIDVYTVADYPAYFSEPYLSQTFTQYGVTAFELFYWNGNDWAAVPGGVGLITGNSLVRRSISFLPLNTSKIRVKVNAAVDGVVRIAEVEAWSPSSTSSGNSSAQIHWMITDQLGTPRMILDQSGDFNGVTRHDYLPFGEELAAGTGGRTTAQGYGASDSVRQKFTDKERDAETGLDWFGPGRYYSSTQGRFTSVDPSDAGAKVSNPQSLNRYTYTLNRPTIAIDPDGLSTIVVSVTVPANGGNPTADVIFYGKIGGNGADAAVRYDGLAAGQGRDRMATNNDTPYGTYSYDGFQGGTADSRLGIGFGTGKIIISGLSGEITDSGRSLIRLHGGGSRLGDPGAYDLNRDLLPTQGCVRMHNGDVNGLIGYIGTANSNQDPLDRVFIGSATALNTMANQTDRNGSYVNPDLRLAMGRYNNEQERQALVTADANRRAEVQRQREEQQRQRQERQRQRQQRRHPENQ